MTLGFCTHRIRVSLVSVVKDILYHINQLVCQKNCFRASQSTIKLFIILLCLRFECSLIWLPEMNISWSIVGLNQNKLVANVLIWWKTSFTSTYVHEQNCEGFKISQVSQITAILEWNQRWVYNICTPSYPFISILI